VTWGASIAVDSEWRCPWLDSLGLGAYRCRTEENPWTIGQE
jgi:hypothetical protein